MGTIETRVVASVRCQGAEEAQLVEKRIYPADLLDAVASGFQISALFCSQAERCREAGAPCRWTGLNPNYDPFAE